MTWAGIQVGNDGMIGKYYPWRIMKKILSGELSPDFEYRAWRSLIERFEREERLKEGGLEQATKQLSESFRDLYRVFGRENTAKVLGMLQIEFLYPEEQKSIMEQYEELKLNVVKRKKEFDEFINVLENETNWLTAPASTRYRLIEEGGLLTHSVRVCNTYLKLLQLLAPNISVESGTVDGLFHDAGKAGMPGVPYYMKQEDGSYIKNPELEKMQPGMTVAQRSLLLISNYIPLSHQERQAVEYHDGLYRPENWAVANDEYPQTILLIAADGWTAGVTDINKPVVDGKPFNRKDAHSLKRN